MDGKFKMYNCKRKSIKLIVSIIRIYGGKYDGNTDVLNAYVENLHTNGWVVNKSHWYTFEI